MICTAYRSDVLLCALCIADPAAVQEKCTVPPDDEINCERDQDVGHVVKSPPEPTRVKSPEQIMMRSPDPVNWTVPLDTGKTFTVTQNVREGENDSCVMTCT